MAEVQNGHSEEHHGDHFHMPPNSFSPISASLALCVTMVGFLDQVRSAIGPAMWIIGLLWLLASIFAWVRAARIEYLALPESLND